MKGFVVTGVAAGFLGLSGLASAQGVALQPDDVIATRQAGMALTGGLVASMKAAVKSEADVKQFEEPAAAIAEWGAAYPKLFPDGTQAGHDTKAKSTIWSDRAGFEAAAARLVKASQTLADAAKAGDKAAFATAFTAEGQACGNCHRNYKEK